MHNNKRRYFALNGINILLLIARMLKLMDFQPRLGVVTRSLWLAGPDLIHFAIVAGMVSGGQSGACARVHVCMRMCTCARVCARVCMCFGRGRTVY